MAGIPPAGSGQLLYVNGQNPDEVRSAWSTVVAGRPEFRGSAFLGPVANRWLPLAVKALDKLSPEQAAGAAKELSAVLDTEVLQLSLSSDGRAWYFLWDEGKLLDRYCSNPGKAGEVDVEVVRSWQGRPELLLPLCRGTPLSTRRSEVSLTDFNGFLYFYYPEMKTTRPESWRTAPDLVALLVQVVGLPLAPASFHSIVGQPGWLRIAPDIS
jgi:hypothetical protein